MKNEIYGIGVCVLSMFLCVSCGYGERDSEPAEVVERMDSAAVCYMSASQKTRDSLNNAFSPALPLLASMFGAGSVDSAIAVYARTPAVEVFAPDVAARMPDITEYETALGYVRAILAQKLPGLKFPAHIYGMVTPFRQSVVMSDSVLFLGLNHYLGTDYPGYAGFDEYVLRDKVSMRIPMDVAEAIVASAYPYEFSGDGETVLSRMVYDGAIVAVVLGCVPDKTLADVLGWDAEELKWVEENESNIWSAIVERGLLYSTDRMDSERLVGPSPATSVLHADAPGRIGRYIGYRIVKSYLENNLDVKLSDVLSPGFYKSRTVLMDSGYVGH